MTINRDVEVLRQSIRAVTQILTESNVKVTQQGVEAYTVSDPKTGNIKHINLPYLPDDASEQLIQAVQGYLDHEVGHALFTDFQVGKSVTDDLTNELHNIVEDAFVERKMAEKFRGSAYNLGNVGAFYRERYLDKVIESGDPDEIKRALSVAAIRALSGQQQYIDYMSDKWHHLDEFKQKVEPLSKQLSQTKSSQDCLDAAVAIKKALSDDEPPSPPQPNQPNNDDNDDESEDSGETDKEEGNSEKDKDEGSEGEGDNSSEEGDESENDEDADEQEGDSGSDDGSEDSNESNSEGDSEEGDSDGDSEFDSNAADGQEGGDDSKPSMADIIKGGLKGGFGDSLASEVADAARDSDYLIYSDEFDTIGPYEQIGFGRLSSDKEMSDFEDEVMHMMSPIQKDIERAICARSLSTYTGGHRSGKLHSSALSRLKTGDDRVFRRKQVNTTKDVDVTLVIDNSGSMSGSKIRLASLSAFALSSVLERLGINNEVIGFTTGGMPNDAYTTMRQTEVDYGLKYARYCTTVMPIFKGFGEKMTPTVKKRLASSSLGDGEMGANADGESILIAYKRLMSQKGKGKIMIVLSDGLPAFYGNANPSKHLEQSVKQIEAGGVNVIGIGIQTTAVNQFYSKSIVVNNVNELPTVVAGQLKRALLSKAG
jgi:cobaltochelatase CobT